MFEVFRYMCELIGLATPAIIMLFIHCIFSIDAFVVPLPPLICLLGCSIVSLHVPEYTLCLVLHVDTFKAHASMKDFTVIIIANRNKWNHWTYPPSDLLAPANT